MDKIKKVNELDIHINKAIVTSISVDLEEDTPIWVVSGKLLTSQNQAISTFTFSNRSWTNENSKINIPIEANMLGKDLFVIFNPVVLEKLGNMFQGLPTGGL